VALESEDEILECGNFNESYREGLSSGLNFLIAFANQQPEIWKYLVRREGFN